MKTSTISAFVALAAIALLLALFVAPSISQADSLRGSSATRDDSLQGSSAIRDKDYRALPTAVFEVLFSLIRFLISVIIAFLRALLGGIGSLLFFILNGVFSFFSSSLLTRSTAATARATTAATARATTAETPRATTAETARATTAETATATTAMATVATPSNTIFTTMTVGTSISTTSPNATMMPNTTMMPNATTMPNATKMPNPSAPTIDTSETTIEGRTMATAIATTAPRAFRRVFVSSQAYTGNLGGVDGADQKCNDLARIASVPGTFMAWISNITSSPFVRFVKSPFPYVRMDDVRFADDYNSLVEGFPLAPLNVTESREGGIVDGVWTNTDRNGWRASSMFHCDNWNTANSENTSVYGQPDIIERWTVSQEASCSSSLRLFCFEQ